MREGKGGIAGVLKDREEIGGAFCGHHSPHRGVALQ